MPYASRDDLHVDDDLLTWLTDASGVGVADDAVIEDGLGRMSQRIDRYLAQRYTLPWADTEGQLRDLCSALTRHWLYLLRPDGPEIPKAIVDAHALAERDLREIAAGRMTLAGSSISADAAPAEPGKLRVNAGARRFTRDEMDRW